MTVQSISTLNVRRSSHVLIVEPDASSSAQIASYLERAGYRASTARTPSEMRTTLDGTRVDMVILDGHLRDEGGGSALRWLRSRHAVPIIVLAGDAQPVDRVIGLELGADDYMAKPFDPRELLARMRTIERRVDRAKAEPPPDMGEALRFDGWTLDVACRRLTSSAGAEEHLTQHEYRILVLLVRNPRRVVSRDQLMDATVGRRWEPFDRSIDVHISNLRRKIDPDPLQPSLIRTVRGAGYMFVPSHGA